MFSQGSKRTVTPRSGDDDGEDVVFTTMRKELNKMTDEKGEGKG